jgi:hypothetical protein
LKVSRGDPLSILRLGPVTRGAPCLEISVSGWFSNLSSLMPVAVYGGFPKGSTRLIDAPWDILRKMLRPPVKT